MWTSLRAKNYFILTFLLLLAVPKKTLGIGQVTLDTLECSYSSNYLSDFNATIVNSAINMDLILVHPLIQGYRGNVDMQMRLARNAKYQSLFAYDFDVCNVMHNVQQLKIMQKWYKKVLKYGNFMENCPILEGMYYLRNLTLDSSNIPAYLQIGEYRIIARSYFGKFRGKTEKFVCECLVSLQLQ